MTARGWLITTRRIYSPFLNSNDLNSKNTLNIPSFLGSAALSPPCLHLKITRSPTTPRTRDLHEYAPLSLIGNKTATSEYSATAQGRRGSKVGGAPCSRLRCQEVRGIGNILFPDPGSAGPGASCDPAPDTVLLKVSSCPGMNVINSGVKPRSWL